MDRDRLRFSGPERPLDTRVLLTGQARAQDERSCQHGHLWSQFRGWPETAIVPDDLGLGRLSANGDPPDPGGLDRLEALQQLAGRPFGAGRVRRIDLDEPYECGVRLGGLSQ